MNSNFFNKRKVYKKRRFSDGSINKHSDDSISSIDSDTKKIEEYTVSELSNKIKKAIITNIQQQIMIIGELSNVKINNSNLFANLKDESSSIDVRIWNISNITKEVFNNGDVVKMKGKVDYYVKFGNINFIANTIEKTGIGDINNEMEKIKQKYLELGYFTNKKQRPPIIRKIGIVTALTGAALQDILRTFNKNNFRGEVIIKNCLAQGNGCNKSISKAISYLDNYKFNDGSSFDTILITRGGGSFEDLMGFSDPLVIEAIYSSKTFTISAVGHEVDTMLSDLVADYRESTPTAGAEFLCACQKDIEGILKSYDDKINRIYSSFSDKIDQYLHKLYHIKDIIKSPNAFLLDIETKLNTYDKIVDTNIFDKLLSFTNKINNITSQIEGKNIKKVLDIGFIILIDEENKTIKSISQIKKKKQKLKMILADGETNVIVKKIIEDNIDE